MKSNKKHIIIFAVLLFAAVAAVSLSLPQMKTYAYRPGTSESYAVRKGTLLIRNVDENNQLLDGAEYTISVKRYEEGDTTPSKDDPSANISGEEAGYGNDYLDNSTDFFSYENENKAILTITQTQEPHGYKPITQDIVLNYEYNNHDGATIFPPSTELPGVIEYTLDITVAANPGGCVTAVDYWYGYHGAELQWQVTIKHTPQGDADTVYHEKYSYRDADSLPGAVKKTLPTRNEDYHDGDEVIPASPDKTSVYVKKERKTYTFDGWEPESVIIDGADAEFTGSWTVVEDKTYTEKYSYRDADSLPEAVKDTLPTRSKQYYDKDEVIPASPGETSVYVEEENKTYTFNGWEPESVIIDGADAVFVGSWTAEEDPVETFEITYDLNGGKYKGSSEDIVETYAKGEEISIHEAPTRKGYTFTYWKGSEYQPGDKYTVVEDHTFTAQWKKSSDTPETTLEETTTIEETPTLTETTTAPETTTKDDTQKTTPKTGDSSNGFASIVTLCVSSAVMVLLAGIQIKRKRIK